MPEHAGRGSGFLKLPPAVIQTTCFQDLHSNMYRPTGKTWAQLWSRHTESATLRLCVCFANTLREKRRYKDYLETALLLHELTHIPSSKTVSSSRAHKQASLLASNLIGSAIRLTSTALPMPRPARADVSVTPLLK
jgi:hypothetical protein